MKHLKKLGALITAVVMIVMCGTMLCINSLASENDLIDTDAMPKVCDLIPMIKSNYCTEFANGSATLMSINSEEEPSNSLDNIRSTSGIKITTAISYIEDYNANVKQFLKNQFENAIITLENQYNIEIDIEAVNSTVTNTYNCHAYAWYGAPSNGLCWIRDPQVFFDDPLRYNILIYKC